MQMDYEDSDLKEIEIVYKYQSNGVLESLQEIYDGKLFFMYEIYGVIPESLLIIGGIIIAIIGSIGIAVFLFIRHRR